MKTLDDKQQFIELRAKGYSFSKIAANINVSKPTLIKWSQEESTNRDIGNYRSVYIDELREEYEISKNHRLETFGGVLKKIKVELSKRDLSDVPTERLLNMLIKTSDSIRQDETELYLTSEPEVALFDVMKSKSWEL